VLGVSGDTLATHQAFAKEHGISFPLIDDADGAVRKLYGSGRTTYLIDKEGVVRLIMQGVPDNAVLLKELAKLPR
jgi:peroxiredoxin Q/BCP